jgi:hypothetical protein
VPHLSAADTRIVVASSDKAYGAHDRLPYTEDTPLQGRFPYDVSKSCTDLISLSYYHTYGLPVAITRCGNLYGGGDLNYNRLIPGTIRSVLMGERPIVRSDGSFVRDYFFVRDAVSAYLQLAERLPEPEFAGQAFNFGTETPLSVLDIVYRLLAIMGRPDLEPVILNEASHEIPRQYLDCSKARRMMDWRPAFTLDEGLMETVDWYQTRLSEQQARRRAHAVGTSRSACGWIPRRRMSARQGRVDPELSIVIPAFNEETRIAPTLDEIVEYCRGRGSPWEVIVVDDGSLDGTSGCVREYTDAVPELRLLRLPVNIGKGFAVRTGVLNARGGRILFADADGSTPIDEVERLERELASGADVAIGSRVVAGDDVRVRAQLHRRLIGRCFHLLVQLLAVRGFRDTQCGFKLFRAAAAHDLFARMRMNGFSFDVELLLMAIRQGYAVREVPVNWTHRPGSRINLMVDSTRMALDLFVIRGRLLSGRYDEPFVPACSTQEAAVVSVSPDSRPSPVGPTGDRSARHAVVRRIDRHVQDRPAAERLQCTGRPHGRDDLGHAWRDRYVAELEEPESASRRGGERGVHGRGRDEPVMVPEVVEDGCGDPVPATDQDQVAALHAGLELSGEVPVVVGTGHGPVMDGTGPVRDRDGSGNHESDCGPPQQQAGEAGCEHDDEEGYGNQQAATRQERLDEPDRGREHDDDRGGGKDR